jgi:2-polyprenyl-6-methoxyphenol hydroxylase-like FAD-dependent oxidoreductase
MFDVAIVGARCSGSSLGMLLARQGARVLLVDRATFPSDIPHGHFIHRHGPARLHRWGVLDQIAARTPAVSNLLYDAGDFPLVARNLVEDGIAWGYAPRRLTLDKILLDAAVTSGVEVREGFSVDEFVFDDGRVAGIQGRGSNGQHVEERATLVVGADGRNSPLARAVQAPAYNQVPPLLCYYFSYWNGVQAEQFELYVRPDDRRVILAFETEDDLFAIFIGFPVDEFPAFRSDIEAAFMRTLDSIPGFGDRVRAGRREERFYGASDLPNFYRKPFGPGWALVGDAGMHKDPYLALGICDGLRDAELLATAIGTASGGERPMEDALAAYETQRNEASAADYEQNLAAARFLPMPPEVQAVRAAVRHRPDDTTQLIKAAMGMIEPQQFFNPQNMQRLLGGAPPAPV